MAQLVEQRIRNAWVAGSSPAVGSIEFAGQSLMRLTFFCCLGKTFRPMGKKLGKTVRLMGKMERYFPVFGLAHAFWAKARFPSFALLRFFILWYC